MSNYDKQTELDLLTPPIDNNNKSTLHAHQIGYTLKNNKGTKALCKDIDCTINSGGMLAILGPSGAGKSTLLDLMSGRKPLDVGGLITLNGHELSPKDIRLLSSFVEQEEALLGVLTARESISYALRLASPKAPAAFVKTRTSEVIKMLGLESCADLKIGTPIQRGLSGGQKRRVSIGCGLVTYPRILYLDEPTSGLDSFAAQEVIAAVQRVAQAEEIIVVATIHQPSLATISPFSKLVLLGAGQVSYEGSVGGLEQFVRDFGTEVPRHATPTDVAMSILNTDFQTGDEEQMAGGTNQAQAFHTFYQSRRGMLQGQSDGQKGVNMVIQEQGQNVGAFQALWRHTMILTERTFLNYSRNLLAYGIRIGMYAGMGLMLAVIWVHLGYNASTINDRLSIHFYSVAFLSFMSVAGIPSFLEERAAFKRESANGLYKTLPFVLSNTLVNIPFLFVCCLFFLLIVYWSIPLHSSGPAFGEYLGILFLSVFAAESQSAIITSLLPIFVAALSINSFLNGFWMSVGGYFIKTISLPAFWRYSFHYMDYQTYAFALLCNIDLRGDVFNCVGAPCPYPSTIGNQAVSGQNVLDYLQIGDISLGKYTAILICIIIIFRIALYLALRFR